MLVLVKQPPAIHIHLSNRAMSAPAFSGTASDHLHGTCWGVSLSPQTQLRQVPPLSEAQTERAVPCVLQCSRGRTAAPTQRPPDSGYREAGLGMVLCKDMLLSC